MDFLDAPTPWMSVNSPYENQMQYRFRIFLRRRGGALHVETHNTSPLHPARTLTVRASKPGFFDFVKAAHGLLRIAVWDKTCQPGTRAVWHEGHAEYGLRMQYATTVAAFLPRIFEPMSGRPRKDALAGGSRAPVPRTAYARVRRARREQMLLLTQSLTNVLVPALETVGKWRPPYGYMRAEVRRIQQHITQLQRINQVFRDEVFSDGLTTTPESLRAYHEAAEEKEQELMQDKGIPNEEAMAQAQAAFDELMKGLPTCCFEPVHDMAREWDELELDAVVVAPATRRYV